MSIVAAAKIVIGGLAAVGIGSQVMRLVAGPTGEGEEGELSAADRLSWTTDLIQKLGRIVNKQPEEQVQYVDQYGNPSDENGNPLPQQPTFDPYDPYAQQPQQSQPYGYGQQGEPLDQYGRQLDQNGQVIPGAGHKKIVKLHIKKKKPKTVTIKVKKQ